MNEFDDRIIVVDSYPGSGKTSWAINYINSLSEDTKVIYITPYLDEIERIISKCPEKNFYQPSPKFGAGSKMNHLFKLIGKGSNIVSTHALFKNIDDTMINLLRSNDYVLILDEVFQTVEKYDISEDNNEEITRKDVDVLLSKNLIKVEDDFRVIWVDHEDELSKYKNLMSLCERNLLYLVNNSLLMWTFPSELFKDDIFSQIFILTHRFESQLQSYYYNYFDVKYTKYVCRKNDYGYYITKDDDHQAETEWKNFIKQKIHILENDKINRIGNIYKDSRNHSHEGALSKTWYDKNRPSLLILKRNMSNYFQNISKSKAEERLWTCFKEHVNDMAKGKYISKKHWLACNARATNNYSYKTCLAYMINRYVSPFYDDFFNKKNIVIDQDEFALSEMIQWIWRSAIRNGQDINIYIPSERMRTLLKKYLNDEKVEF